MTPMIGLVRRTYACIIGAWKTLHMKIFVTSDQINELVELRRQNHTKYRRRANEPNWIRKIINLDVLFSQKIILLKNGLRKNGS